MMAMPLASFDAETHSQPSACFVVADGADLLSLWPLVSRHDRVFTLSHRDTERSGSPQDSAIRIASVVSVPNGLPLLSQATVAVLQSRLIHLIAGEPALGALPWMVVLPAPWLEPVRETLSGAGIKHVVALELPRAR
ncbi:hypothetical protein MHM84_20385 [Halomonas sp. McH1-25]|uniref:hypothetical protein n=1 Tax=unclassified Halomonas TaxID=2609666 RepID=UPI001EF48ABC|nr:MULTISPECIES: hypothetical protein [unclassified Halomonas]MCG7602102.1 hypothetical protein [Halomonas sp. McH1-25]MCP1343020.1 hypothetical protein [Halomonas sp. FL8]MCP1362442.1 hypothetical protein [Halomonas sp. BBD45]MCP1365640.1 hypothetical protein [Halomonas sp. BBD48]